MLPKLTKAAAECILAQCGREYGFGSYQHEKARATQVFLFTVLEERVVVGGNI